ncbi:MAG: VOC family protein, partial [Bryobacteraceae bacterium]
MQLRRIHHVELWVGNARQSSYFYEHAFGFRPFAYAGLETGQRRATSFAVEQGKARLMLTAPLLPDSPEGEHVRKHGDGVRDIAFEVDDAGAAFDEAVAKGAEPVEQPHDLADSCGAMRHAAIRAYGDTIHSFLSNVNYRGPFLPGFSDARPAGTNGHDAGILRIDHIVGNVELGKMTEWAAWYSRVLGFERYMSFDDKDISTEYSALMSVVMSDDSHSVKFPINEPAAGRRKSQIQEYLDYYNGPGVQHIALQT